MPISTFDDDCATEQFDRSRTGVETQLDHVSVGPLVCCWRGNPEYAYIPRVQSKGAVGIKTQSRLALVDFLRRLESAPIITHTMNRINRRL